MELVSLDLPVFLKLTEYKLLYHFSFIVRYTDQ